MMVPFLSTPTHEDLFHNGEYLYGTETYIMITEQNMVFQVMFGRPTEGPASALFLGLQKPRWSSSIWQAKLDGRWVEFSFMGHQLCSRNAITFIKQAYF